MATQYQDGSFGETKEMPEAMEEFFDAMEAGTAKAFHVGTPEQIEAAKEESSLSDKVVELAAKLKEFELERDGVIVKPTFDEMAQILDGINK